MASREQNYSQENEKQEASHFPTQLTSLLLSAPSYMIWVPKSDKDLFEFPLDNHQILCFLTYLLPSSNVYDMCSYEQICTFAIKISGKDTKTFLESRV